MFCVPDKYAGIFEYTFKELILVKDISEFTDDEIKEIRDIQESYKKMRELGYR